jgi:hypothetical protein
VLAGQLLILVDGAIVSAAAGQTARRKRRDLCGRLHQDDRR